MVMFNSFLLVTLCLFLYVPTSVFAITPADLPVGCFAPLADTPCPSGDAAAKSTVWAIDLTSKVCASTSISTCFVTANANTYYTTEADCKTACTPAAGVTLFIPPPACVYPLAKVNSAAAACKVSPTNYAFGVQERTKLNPCELKPMYDCTKTVGVTYYTTVEECNAACAEKTTASTTASSTASTTASPTTVKTATSAPDVSNFVFSLVNLFFSILTGGGRK